MTDKIREAFEKWVQSFQDEEINPFAFNLSPRERAIANSAFLAGSQSLLDELEHVGFTAMFRHGRVIALQPTAQPEKWEPVYRLSNARLTGAEPVGGASELKR
jgi:hypothetical protein